MTPNRLPTMTKGTRLVWSSDGPTVCAGCGKPPTKCRCGPTAAPIDPRQRLTAKIRLESAGRGGKEVTVVYGLPSDRDLLRALATELKKACGSGGTATNDGVEIQGDRRAKVREVLLAKGWIVKGG
jgi:translation initiation factor 1